MTNLQWQEVLVDKAARRRVNRHGSAVVWLTGLSGAGKSTVAVALERLLHVQGIHTYLLDGDNVRHGLSSDLGFAPPDRIENIRRVAEVARLMVDAGLIVIAALISPFRNERRAARALFDEGEFIEVFIDTQLEVAEQRDTKGLYKKARLGQIKDFTGISSPYEAPTHADIAIDTTVVPALQAATLITEHLHATGILPMNGSAEF